MESLGGSQSCLSGSNLPQGGAGEGRQLGPRGLTRLVKVQVIGSLESSAKRDLRAFEDVH